MSDFDRIHLCLVQVDTDDEEDEDAWREDGDDGLDPNEVGKDAQKDA